MKTDTCARDSRALQQHALNVHIKPSDQIGWNAHNTCCVMFDSGLYSRDIRQPD